MLARNLRDLISEQWGPHNPYEDYIEPTFKFITRDVLFFLKALSTIYSRKLRTAIYYTAFLSHYKIRQGYLKHFDLARANSSALTFTKCATPAHNRAEWRKLLTKRPFDVDKQHVRPPRCDTRVTPEVKRRFMAQRAALMSRRDAPSSTPRSPYRLLKPSHTRTS